MMKPRRPMEFLLIAALAVAVIAVYFFHLGEDRSGVVAADKKNGVLLMRDRPAPLVTEEAGLGR